MTSIGPAGVLVRLGCMLCVGCHFASADELAAGEPAPSAPHDVGPGDTLIVSGSGTELSSSRGGAGGGIDWLHGSNENLKLTAGAHFYSIAAAHWTFGSLGGALTLGSSWLRPLTLYGDLQLGAGHTDTRAFSYSVATVGLSRAVSSRFRVQLEDRQIDVDTTHGNLPKVELTLLGSPQWFASASYAHSAGGNLGTELIAARIDYQRGDSGYFAGVATGHGASVAADVQFIAAVPSSHLRQAFLGFSHPLGRARLLLGADYLTLGGVERVTFSATLSMPLGPTRRQ